MKQQAKSFLGQFQAARQEVAQLRSWMGESAKVATLTFPTPRTSSEEVERFAAIVAAAVYENEDMFAEAYAGGFKAGAAAEREACAKFVEDEYVRQFDEPWRQHLARSIRARSNNV